MHASIYDEALSQLHINYQSLQENIINMVREQTRMSETISRLQLDLESYKDTQNERLDDMLCNVDTDVKRVFHEIRKVLGTVKIDYFLKVISIFPGIESSVFVRHCLCKNPIFQPFNARRIIAKKLVIS